jgi:hypothetical protein
MIRKALFLGLTLLLGAILVWLVINGRREGARQAAAPVESVKTAKLSPTRMVAPADLDAAEAPASDAAANRKPGMLGAVVIRNRGQLAYHGVMLRLSCLGNGGKELDTRIKLIPDTIQPGQSITVADLFIESVAPGTIGYSVGIVYADLGPARQPE